MPLEPAIELDPRATWQQPDDATCIAYDGETALMSQATFDLLTDSTGIRPRPLWEGKMWRVRFREAWWLAWVNRNLSIDWKEIVIV